MATRLSDGPGDVDALPEAHRGEQARRLVGGELLEQAGLGHVALGEDRYVEAELQGGGRLVEHSEAGEQRQGAPAGRLDEVAELIGERGHVAGVARIGKVGGAVEEGVGLVVERAADIELDDLRRRHAEPAREPGREGGAGEHGGALVPQHLRQEAGHVEWARPAASGCCRCPPPTSPGRR